METTGSVSVPSSSFCTETFAPNERFEAWRKHVNSSFGCANVSRFVREPFSGSLEGTIVGPLSTAMLKTSSIVFERTVRHISQESAYVLVALVKDGSAILEHCGHRSRMEPGDLVIGDFRQPLRLVCQGPFEEALLKIDYELFTSRFPHMRRSSGVAFRQKSSLFFDVTNYIAAAGSRADARTQELLTQHALEALAITLNEPPNKSSAHGLLLRIQNYIEDSLSNPQLSPTLIALHHRVSRRQLYRLFSNVEGTIADYIRHRRLLRSKLFLADRSQARRSISEIAFDVGFGDITTFGRAFRSAFGMSPREFRSTTRDPVAGERAHQTPPLGHEPPE